MRKMRSPNSRFPHQNEPIAHNLKILGFRILRNIQLPTNQLLPPRMVTAWRSARPGSLDALPVWPPNRWWVRARIPLVSDGSPMGLWLFLTWLTCFLFLIWASLGCKQLGSPGWGDKKAMRQPALTLSLFLFPSLLPGCWFGAHSSSVDRDWVEKEQPITFDKKWGSNTTSAHWQHTFLHPFDHTFERGVELIDFSMPSAWFPLSSAGLLSLSGYFYICAVLYLTLVSPRRPGALLPENHFHLVSESGGFNSIRWNRSVSGTFFSTYVCFFKTLHIPVHVVKSCKRKRPGEPSQEQMHEHLDDHLSETKVPEVQRSMLHLNSLNSLAPIALIAPIRPIGPWVPWVPWIRRLSPQWTICFGLHDGHCNGKCIFGKRSHYKNRLKWNRPQSETLGTTDNDHCFIGWC